MHPSIWRAVRPVALARVAGRPFALLATLLGIFSADAHAYSLIGPRWTAPAVTMHLQLGPTNTALLDGSTSWDAAAEDALELWNRNIGSTQFVSQRNSTAARGDGNGINNVFFSGSIYGESWGTGVLAVTLIHYSGQQMAETDVLFNSGYTWNSYRGPQQGGTIDFHRVALHEFGHAMGLDHPDAAGQWVTAVMNAYVSDVDGLMLDDVSGARALYGAPGTNAPPVVSAPPAPPPVILTQPRNQTVTAGDSVAFTVTVSSQVPATYRWLKNGQTISGAVTATLTRNAVTLADAGSYVVIATNSGGSATSLAATLTVIPPSVLPPGNPTNPPPATASAPIITTQPVSRTVTQGGSASFTVAATGSGPLAFQWLKNGTASAGATNATLNFSSAQPADAGTYTARVSNSAGNVTSAAALLTVNTLPVISAQPLPVTVTSGASATLSVTASGSPPPDFQWQKDGVNVPGGTAASLTLATVQPSDAGRYTVMVRNSAGTVTSAAVTLTVNFSRLVNLSTRGYLAPGTALTPGFVIRGAGSKPLVVRAIGPGLAGFGINAALTDLKLAVIPSGSETPLLANDRWGGAADLTDAFARVGAFPLLPASEDAAAQTSLAGGAYTVRITPQDAGASGIALAELYDAGSLAASARLVNASTLGFVGVGEKALTPGFVISGTAAKRLLIRAVGPGLAAFGLTEFLRDPMLEIYPMGQGGVSASNDNWAGAQELKDAFTQAGAFALADDSKDAAIVVTLAPGGYSVVITGAASTTGTALVEIYDLDP